MVYKIVGDFNNENFEVFMKKLTPKFKIMYRNEVLYIALTSLSLFESEEACERMVRNVFKPKKDFLVQLVTQSNVKKEAPDIADWLTQAWVKLEKEKLAQKEQARLQKLWKDMDEFEKIVDEKIKRGEIRQIDWEKTAENIIAYKTAQKAAGAVLGPKGVTTPGNKSKPSGEKES